ncbi:MAG TPA: DUF370 domain-containing protein [Firmicutes bacterium]|nr:DUF370 domain-containing protein [Candidatus Fermentithermobacillaceae bacterium]
MSTPGLDIGGGVMVPVESIVCVVPWQEALKSRSNRDLVSSLRARGKMTVIGDSDHRSLVICNNEIYLSFLSPATISLRARRL